MTPAVAGDLVFVGSCSGRYYAFRAGTGAIAWTYDTRRDGPPRSFHGDPEITDELVVTPSDGPGRSFTYAPERTTGAVRWKRPGAIVSDLLRSGGRVVGIEQEGGDLVAIEIADGETAWRLEPGGSGPVGIDHSPVVMDGFVYAPGNDGSVWAADLATGEVRWRTDLGCLINTGLASEDGAIHVGCNDGRLFRISTADGSFVAEGRLVEGFPIGRPTAVEEGVVYLVGTNPMSGGGPRYVALDADLESVRWEAFDEATWSSMQPLPWRGLLVVGNGAGEIVGLQPGDGEVVWRKQLEGTIRGLGASQGMLFVGTLEGTVYALETRRLETGSERPECSARPLNEPVAATPNSDDLLVRVASRDRYTTADDVAEPCRHSQPAGALLSPSHR